MAFVNQTYAAIKDVIDKRVVLQMDDTIYLDRPERNALLAYMSRHNLKRSVKGYEAHYLTKKTRPPYIPLAVAYDASVDLGVFSVYNGDGVWFEPGTIFFNGAIQMKTTSVTPAANTTDPDTVTAVVWPSTQVDTDLAVDANLIMSYPIYGDLSDAPVGNYVDTIDNTVYLEQMMRGITLSQSLIKTQKYGKDVRAMEHDLALMAWKTDIEMKFLFSKMYKDTTNANVATVGTIWNTGGMNEFLTSKVQDFGSTNALDIDTILGYLPDFMEFAAPTDWILYVPASFLQMLQLKAQDKLWYDTEDDSFGYAVRKWTTSFGDFPLVWSRMLDYLSVPAMFFLNKNEIKKVDFETEDGMEGAPRLYLNAQLPNQPNKVHDFFRGIMGLQRGWENRSCKVFDWKVS